MQLSGASIFITGGTGFIGKWLLEFFRYANHELGLNIKVSVLTRNIDHFARQSPHLAECPFFSYIQGDVSNFNWPTMVYTHVIHAATDASAALNEKDPLKMFSTIVNGTQRVLAFAVEKKVNRVLYLSSGAVYGKQPIDLKAVPETWLGAPDCYNPISTYGEAKRAAEMLCSIHAKQFGLQVSVARIFALIGPYLPLSIHFAAGNFLRDAINGKKVVVQGNGLPIRSYLYSSDLITWLLKILISPAIERPINVGSPHSISIGNLAEKISKLVGTGDFEISRHVDDGWNTGAYVPDVTFAHAQLGLTQNISLDQAILRTAIWNGWNGKR